MGHRPFSCDPAKLAASFPMHFFAVLALLFAASAAAAAPPTWSQAVREEWVLAVPSGAAPGPLHDRQIRITANGDDRYEHTVLQLTAAQAAGQDAAVMVVLDPRFQTLVINSLRLSHSGDAGLVFTAAQIRRQLRTQAAEGDAHKRELDPRVQLSLDVQGARAGDLLECEYTVHTHVTQFAGLFAGHYAAQWARNADQPVRWERLHVSWPLARALQFRVSAAAAGVAPQVHTQPGELDVQWRESPRVVEEADTPRWFDRESTVQLSDFGDWTQVAALLGPQYSGIEPQDLPIQPAAGVSPDLVLNALRLLQTKVHPVIGIGSGPYLPADPAQLLQRGYGDSRDLARVLAALLRRLGIDAQVALADSRRGARLPTALPSPFILDSGLVVIHAGRTEYWISPALPAPDTALESTDPGDLRHALMITGDAGKIIALPQPAPDSRQRLVSQQFDLRAAAIQPVPLTVITQYHGSWARAMRAQLRSQTPAQQQLAQIQAVAEDYPAATPVGEATAEELPDGQTLQLTARFRIPHALGDAQDPHFDLFAEGLAAAVEPRDEATRQFPLSLPWPSQLEQHIEVLLPADFQVLPGTLQINTAQFRYQREVRVMPGRLQITHRYLALTDHVEPADYPGFLEANARVHEALGLRLRPHGSAWHRALGWLADRLLIMVAIAVVVGTVAMGAWRRLRRS